MHISNHILSRSAIAICLAVISSGAQAVTIPSLGTSSSYDEFRTSSGMVCRQAVSGGAQLQVGGSLSQDDSKDDYTGNGSNRRDYNRDEKALFIQLVVPLGVPDRIDCTTLYNIEVEKQQIELQQLKAQIDLLKRQAALAGLQGLPEL
ncbi:MAG: hypothetical protein ACRC6V_06625 [Bacteroidales bacterium]